MPAEQKSAADIFCPTNDRDQALGLELAKAVGVGGFPIFGAKFDGAAGFLYSDQSRRIDAHRDRPRPVAGKRGQDPAGSLQQHSHADRMKHLVNTQRQNLGEL